MQREILIITATVLTLGTVLSAPPEPDARPAITVGETSVASSHQQYISNTPYICAQPSTLLVDFGHEIDADGNFVSVRTKTESVTL